MALVTGDWRWQARHGWKYRHVIYRPLMPPGTIGVTAVCGQPVRLHVRQRTTGQRAPVVLPEVDCPRCARICPLAVR